MTVRVDSTLLYNSSAELGPGQYSSLKPLQARIRRQSLYVPIRLGDIGFEEEQKEEGVLGTNVF